MYLPASELQTFRGQFTCPYCIMDLRDAERKENEAIEGKSEKKNAYESNLPQSEKCERCGRTLTMVYFYNGKILCENCVNDEKRSWKDVGGERPPMAMFRVKEEKTRKSGLQALLESIIQYILELLKIRSAKKILPDRMTKEEKSAIIPGTKAPATKSSLFESQGLIEKPATNPKELADFKDVKESKSKKKKKQDADEDEGYS